MIVTTNLTINEMKHPADLAHERIYSRVLERCIPLKIARTTAKPSASAVT